jgi:hypothetical protein
MFGNFTAQAGVIANNLNSSINVISPTVIWDFNNVLVMDYAPYGNENINDRPRINLWRNVNGLSDNNLLVYVSGGMDILSPAPTGNIISIWGDRRTGQVKFLPFSISSDGTDEISAGIDLFTHTFAKPINISPPINEWVIESGIIPNEIKYQYKFKTGETNPIINIELDYNSNCLPINIPSCQQNQSLAYLGTNPSNCPEFFCIDNFSSLERASLYNTNTWVTGSGLAGFGYWLFSSGSGSFRNISNSNQNGRLNIGNEAFFIVGNSGSQITAHQVNFILNEPLKTGEALYTDVNYSWFKGSRVVTFLGTNNFEFRFIHSGMDPIFYGIFENNNFISGGFISNNAYNKAFTYKICNINNGIEVKTQELNSNDFYLSMYTGWTGNYQIPLITGVSFFASLNNIILESDFYNYGLYFNNIKFNKYENAYKYILKSGLNCFSNLFIQAYSSSQRNALQINTKFYSDPILNNPISGGFYIDTVQDSNKKSNYYEISNNGNLVLSGQIICD